MSRSNKKINSTSIHNLFIKERNPNDTEEASLSFTGSSGLIITPSKNVSGRTNITNYVLTSFDNSGKVIWAESQGGNSSSSPSNSIQLSDGAGGFTSNSNLLGTGGNILFTSSGTQNILHTGSSGQHLNISSTNGNVVVENVDFNSGNIVAPGAIRSNTGLILEEPDTGTNTVTIQASNTTVNYTLTLPDNDGSSNQFLQTNGSGVLTWAAAGAGASVAGSNTQLQFNDEGFFGASSDLTWDGNKLLTSGSIQSDTSLILKETGSENTETITIQAPSNVSVNYTLTLPSDNGSSGEFLQTDGSGVLSWTQSSSSYNVISINGTSYPIGSPYTPTSLDDLIVVTGTPGGTDVHINLSSISTLGKIKYFIVNATTDNTDVLINANGSDRIYYAGNGGSGPTVTFTLPSEGDSATLMNDNNNRWFVVA